MALSAGTRVGPYEVVERIGAGGMGEVYRARDVKLERDVAIKVLPDGFSDDAPRVARFEREAKLLASLNHPGIATLHGLESMDGDQLLIMEMVEGETLAQRLARGPLEVEEAMELFTHMADGLASAHDQGVIHRDLKPANVKVTSDGRIKILDFGLAKAFDPAADAEPGTNLSESPTASVGHTRAGVILGTAPYMSPEQARGKSVDKRTDVWAFGCCLYEALAGKPAFSGETVTDTLAAIVKTDPDWNALPAETPWRVRDVLRRTLQKKPGQRIHDMHDVRLELEEATDAPPAPPAPAPAKRSWALPALALVVGALAAWAATPRAEPELPPVTRLSINLQGEMPQNTAGDMALSPDGRTLLYVNESDAHRLYWRPLGEERATALPGAEGAFSAFFSPDGEWAAFFTHGGALKKVDLREGHVVSILDDAKGIVGVWATNGTIVFNRSGHPGLWSVPDSGGLPELLFVPSKDVLYTAPRSTIGASKILYSSQTESSISNYVFDLVDGSRTELAHELLAGIHPNLRFVDGGYLVSHRVGENTLVAIRLDPDGLELRSAPLPLGEHIARSPNGALQYQLARNGDLVKRASGGGVYEMVWVDRSGQATPISETPKPYHRPRISPDGHRFVVAASADDQARDLWLWDIERQVETRFTFTPEHESNAVWSDDGSSIYFASGGGGLFNIFSKNANGSGVRRQITSDTDSPITYAEVPKRDELVIGTVNSAEMDIFLLSLDDGSRRPLIATSAQERTPALSRNGRWLAYVSDETGRDEVYVRPFPSLDGKWQVSTEGGIEPLWSKDGTELFFRNGSRMMRLPVETGERFQYDRPELLFDVPYNLDHANHWANYDVSEDGQRFLMVRPHPDSRSELNVVLGFKRILEEKLGAQ